MNEVGSPVVRQQPGAQGDPPAGSGGDCGVRIAIDEDRCLYKNCSKTNCNVPWHKPCCGLERQDLLDKLKTMIYFVASTQVIVGSLSAYAIYLKPSEYDKLYDTTESMFISRTTFSGWFLVASSGIMLSITTSFSMKRLMWDYLMLANMLCVYILILSGIKIHFALLISEKDLAENEPIDSLTKLKKKELISDGCVYGILMLLGSDKCRLCNQSYDELLGQLERCHMCEHILDPKWSYCELCGQETPRRLLRTRKAKCVVYACEPSGKS